MIFSQTWFFLYTINLHAFFIKKRKERKKERNYTSQDSSRPDPAAIFLIYYKIKQLNRSGSAPSPLSPPQTNPPPPHPRDLPFPTLLLLHPLLFHSPHIHTEGKEKAWWLCTTNGRKCPEITELFFFFVSCGCNEVIILVGVETDVFDFIMGAQTDLTCRNCIVLYLLFFLAWFACWSSL